MQAMGNCHKTVQHRLFQCLKSWHESWRQIQVWYQDGGLVQWFCKYEQMSIVQHWYGCAKKNVLLWILETKCAKDLYSILAKMSANRYCVEQCHDTWTGRRRRRQIFAQPRMRMDQNCKRTTGWHWQDSGAKSGSPNTFLVVLYYLVFSFSMTFSFHSKYCWKQTAVFSSLLLQSRLLFSFTSSYIISRVSGQQVCYICIFLLSHTQHCGSLRVQYDTWLQRIVALLYMRDGRLTRTQKNGMWLFLWVFCVKAFVVREWFLCTCSGALKDSTIVFFVLVQ